MCKKLKMISSGFCLNSPGLAIALFNEHNREQNGSIKDVDVNNSFKIDTAGLLCVLTETALTFLMRPLGFFIFVEILHFL